MIKSKILLTIILVLAALSAVQAAYITDKLVAGLYENAKVDDSPLKALNSGTPLEVIERKNDFIKVRAPDGTVGWVEAAYLTDEKPARSMLLELQAKNSTLNKQLERMLEGKPIDCAQPQADQQAATDCPASEVDSGQLADLQLKLDASTSTLAETESRLKQLQDENTILRQQQQQIAEILQLSIESPATAVEPAVTTNRTALATFIGTLPGWGILLSVLIILLAGIALGYWIMRLKVIRRFGSIVSL